jgi:hypothetical protein
MKYDFEAAQQHVDLLDSYIDRLYVMPCTDTNLRDAADDWLSGEIAQIEQEMKISRTVVAGRLLVAKSNILMPSLSIWGRKRN